MATLSVRQKMPVFVHYNAQITISPTSLFSANFNGNCVKNHPKPWTCPLSCEKTDARGNLISGARSTKGEARCQAGDSFVRGLLTVEVSVKVKMSRKLRIEDRDEENHNC